jgi:hypothetical protein
MADQKVTALTENTTPLSTDMLYIVDDPPGTPASQKIQVGKVNGLLASGTVAAAATLDLVLTAYTAFRGIRIELSGFRPATDASTLFMRFSTDGGSTYDAAAANYSWAFKFAATNTIEGIGNSAGDTEIELGFGVGNASNRGGNWSIKLMNQTSTAFYSRATYDATYMDNAGVGLWLGGMGQRLAAQDTDAVRFLFSAGNIAEGKYAVYGLY